MELKCFSGESKTIYSLLGTYPSLKIIATKLNTILGEFVFASGICRVSKGENERKITDAQVQNGGIN